MTGPRLLLLRHGHVDSHRGDVPLSDRGRRQAVAAGGVLAPEVTGRVVLLSGGTRRTAETAQGVGEGLASVGLSAPPPVVAFCLRNPDLYLGGVRVDLVSAAADFIAQVPALDETAVAGHPFFGSFLTSADRIGLWLTHADPPGEDADAVARRVDAFRLSLADLPLGPQDTVIGVTHSPVLRAVGRRLSGRDDGEPPYLSGFSFGSGAGVVIDPLAGRAPLS